MDNNYCSPVHGKKGTGKKGTRKIGAEKRAQVKNWEKEHKKKCCYL